MDKLRKNIETYYSFPTRLEFFHNMEFEIKSHSQILIL